MIVPHMWAHNSNMVTNIFMSTCCTIYKVSIKYFNFESQTKTVILQSQHCYKEKWLIIIVKYILFRRYFHQNFTQ